MQIDLSSDRFMTALTGITLAGMALATVDAFLIPGLGGPVGLVLVYLAGGVPTGFRALTSLLHERVLDFGLLISVAPLPSSAAGAALAEHEMLLGRPLFDPPVSNSAGAPGER